MVTKLTKELPTPPGRRSKGACRWDTWSAPSSYASGYSISITVARFPAMAISAASLPLRMRATGASAKKRQEDGQRLRRRCCRPSSPWLPTNSAARRDSVHRSRRSRALIFCCRSSTAVGEAAVAVQVRHRWSRVPFQPRGRNRGSVSRQRRPLRRGLTRTAKPIDACGGRLSDVLKHPSCAASACWWEFRDQNAASFCRAWVGVASRSRTWKPGSSSAQLSACAKSAPEYFSSAILRWVTSSTPPLEVRICARTP